MRTRSARYLPRMARALAIVIGITAVGACSPTDRITAPVATTEARPVASTAASQQAQQYLPYGVPVPANARLTLAPQPYNKALHGSAQPVAVASEPINNPEFLRAHAQRASAVHALKVGKVPPPSPGSLTNEHALWSFELAPN